MRFLPGNRIQLLTNGTEFFPALIAAIEAACIEVRLETYIFENDATGQAVSQALANAARRGVAVRVMVDGFGARNFVACFGEFLQAAGVAVLVYRPEVARFRLRRYRLRRLHRKLSVIDGRIAFVGGINIIDDLNTPRQIPPRHDYALRIEGPLLEPIHETMLRLWNMVNWVTFRQYLDLQPPQLPSPNSPGSLKAAFLIRDNLRHRHDIEEAYLHALEQAQKQVVIANAYFLPGRRFQKALIAAARRGVTVTLLLQGRIEYRLLHYATQALYGPMLRAGVQIHEYHAGFLHAKVAVVDHDWATVGSSNIDPFSLLLAREANVIIKDAGFAMELRASLEHTMTTGAHAICDDCWLTGSWYQRLRYRLAYSLVRLLIGMLGYGGQH